MRALIVTHYYAEHRGGIEVVASELAVRLASRGLEVVWAASDEGPVQAEEAVSRLTMRAWNFTERLAGFCLPSLGTDQSLSPLEGRPPLRCRSHSRQCVYG